MMSRVSRFSYFKYSYVFAISTTYLKTTTGEKDACSLVTLPSGLRSSGGQIGDIRVSGSSSPPSLLTFVRRILMKWGGYERAQSSACLWDSGLMGFFQGGKIALAKVFTSMFWFHFLPTGTNLDDKMHKTARQLRKRRYV